MATTIFDLSDATVQILGGGGGESITVPIGEGNLTYSVQRTREFKLDRGNLDQVRNGDDVPMNVTIDGNYDYITGDGAEVTILEALENEEFDGSDFVDLGWTSADTRSGHECDPFCVNIVVTFDPTTRCAGLVGNPVETLTFRYFYFTNVSFDSNAGTLNITGDCNSRKPEGVRSAS